MANLRKEEKQVGRMNEMSATIEELRNAAAVINSAVTWLAERLGDNSSSPEPTPTEPVLTLEAVRAVLAEKSRSGFTTQIRELLLKYGADRLSGIDPVHYKALLAEAEVLGDG